MFLKEVTLKNFRKFSEKYNTISLVQGNDVYKEEKNDTEEELGSEEKSAEEYNFAENITLIVGKNNSGKTTIIRALEKVCNTEKIDSSDFNYKYLHNIFENIKGEIENLSNIQDIHDKSKIFPELSISLKIGFDHNKNDLLSNIYSALELSDVDKENMEIDIEIKWMIKELNDFLKKVQDSKISNKKFIDFCKMIDEMEFEIKYYRSDKEINNFNIKKLLNLHVINATKVREPKNNLSKAFNKILFYRFKNIADDDNYDDLEGAIERNEKDFVDDLEKKIIEFNGIMSNDLDTGINTTLNDALEEVVSDDLFKIILTSNLDIDKLLRNVIQYSYSENDYITAEDNFGLGYSNLVMIIAEIIDYISRYQKKDTPESTINLIAIEEPEVHMHPQMQENFILNVEKMINSLLLGFNKEISTQIIITTHSSHILNSKIHSGNSFNNINYMVMVSKLHTFKHLK